VADSTLLGDIVFLFFDRRFAVFFAFDLLRDMFLVSAASEEE
jgi:hypothetical protein